MRTTINFGRLAVALSVLLATATGMPASAQTEHPTGSNMLQAAPAQIPDTPHLSPAEKARVTISAFAGCVVRRHRLMAEKILAMPALSDEADKAYRQQFHESECLKYGGITMDTRVLRGALFAALYERDFGSAAGSLPGAPIDWSKDNGADKSPQAAQYIALRQFADCAVRSDPAAARGVVLSPPVSPAERDAYVRITPHLNDCVQPSQSLTFSKTVVSGLLAEVLYRDARAVR